MNENYDGQIYFDEKDLPQVEGFLTDNSIAESEENYTIEIEFLEEDAASTVLYRRRLARWKDLTRPPKSRTKCVKMCSVGPVKFCCGWKTELKWYYRTATLMVSTQTPTDLKKTVESCLKTAAVAAAVAAIISGGSAAVAAAEKVLYACLTSKLGDNLLSVSIDLSGKWGNWT